MLEVRTKAIRSAKKVISMTTNPATQPHGAHLPLAWAAVGTACAGVPLVALGIAGFGGAGAGFLLTFVGFVTAVIAKRQHEQWALLWLPLVLFPALLVSMPLWV